jgi:hypothetical protein
MEPRAFHAWLLGWSAVYAAALALTIAAARGHFDDLLVFFGQLALLPVGLGGMCVLWLRRRRAWGPGRRRLDPAAAYVLLTPVVLLPLSFLIYKTTREAMFSSFATRAGLVVEAIERHVEERGEPPVTLGALVPEYLEARPTTGMTAYPTFEYSRSPVGTWRLLVECSPGFAAFDEIRYSPGAGEPGSTTRYGDWLYLHE